MANDNYKVGDQDDRPWGRWRVLAVGTGYIVKQIDVLPEKTLSLQRHQYRSEHWTVVRGEALVTLGDIQRVLTKDDHIYIPVGTKHRVRNQSSSPLTFLEIQTGDRLEESDIERFEDGYGRAR